MTTLESYSPCHLVAQLARALSAGLQAQIGPMGLSAGCYPVMVELWRQDGQSQRELVARIGVEQATMANTLSRMERDGLIARRPDGRDARLRRTWLTERGKLLERDVARIMHEAEARTLPGLSPGEQRRMLELVAKTLRAHQAEVIS